MVPERERASAWRRHRAVWYSCTKVYGPPAPRRRRVSHGRADDDIAVSARCFATLRLTFTPTSDLIPNVTLTSSLTSSSRNHLLQLYRMRTCELRYLEVLK